MDGRRRMTLSDQRVVLNSRSNNLGNLLKVRDEEETQQTFTLGSILRCEKQREVATRTLFDIIREEESSGVYREFSRGSSHHRINWKSFKDRLRIRRTSAAWTLNAQSISVSNDFINSISTSSQATNSVLPPENVISDPLPMPPVTLENGSGNRNEIVSVDRDSQDPVRTDLATALAAERQILREGGTAAGEATEAVGASPVTETENTPIRVSLMALLEQTDRQSSGPFSGGMKRVEAEEEGGEMFVCCVCMVRHKGAAFIPCGHTFCRLCSRELWVSRGNCPLCNGFILEILDIF